MAWEVVLGARADIVAISLSLARAERFGRVGVGEEVEISEGVVVLTLAGSGSSGESSGDVEVQPYGAWHMRMAFFIFDNSALDSDGSIA